MAVDYSGRGASIGGGLETTYGTAVARTVWKRPLPGVTLRRQIDYQPRNPMELGATAALSRGHYTGFDNVLGGFQLPVGFHDTGFWWHHIFGTSGSSGGGPYAHTYTLAAEGPVGATIESIRGSGSAEVFEGCKLNDVTVSCEAGGRMILSVDDVIGETSGGRVSAGSPSYGTFTPVMHHHAGALSWNSLTFNTRSIRMVHKNNLARRPQLGSKLTLEPKCMGFKDTVWQVQAEVHDDVYAAMIADTTADASIAFTSGAHSLTFSLESAYLAGDVSDPVDQPGPLLVSFNLRGQSDGTTDGFKLVVVNATATAVGNG